ncbi:MAG TPA: polysaccharide deacetylase family protein [Anaeromyxobacteraceae bacterium]|nr:polysaccharide deacetylase family protein [Anaeromyxobacteraceae bacterium]
MLASLSIDLDSLQHYHRIHGLAEPAEDGDPVYGKALERFGELCDRLGVRGTVFCVGQNLCHAAAAAAVRGLSEAGHEIANHSFSHDYALARRPPPRIAAELRGGAEAIARATGRWPLGFRAPGYTLSADLLDVLVADGYRYDSSAFPALPYYLGKAAVVSLLAVSGRPSKAVLGSPRVLFAPRRPYQPRRGKPYAPGAGTNALPILELPVATGLFGFPLIGTFVGSFPHRALRALCLGTARLPLFDLELHGLDLLEACDASPALAARQRDLAIPARRKIARIEAFVRSLSEREWVTLAMAAERLRKGIGATSEDSEAPAAPPGTG